MDITLNPAEAYPEVEYEHLGLIPQILETAYISVQETFSRDSFLYAVHAAYGFPIYEIKGGTVHEGIYSYPQDRDLAPIATYHFPEVTVHQYPYAIMAFMFDKPFITRMD